MASKRVKPNLKTVDGVVIAYIFSTDCVREVLRYKPRADDVFIVTYPKCGTTWTQSIVLHIYRKGTPLEDPRQFFTQCPFLEAFGLEMIEKMSRPGALKTHLPFNLQPYNPEAKYITVARNPKDCCVSYYYHCLGDPTLFDSDVAFDDFFELFLTGEVPYGDYFDHTLSWYEHRDDPNVLYLIYEDMKKDTRGTIMKIAKFLGKEYSDLLEKDPSVMDNVLHYTSFQYMKEQLNPVFMTFGDTKQYAKAGSKDVFVTKAMEEMTEKLHKVAVTREHHDFIIMRKGVVGSWKDLFSQEQSERMDRRFEEVLGHTSLATTWSEHMKYLPSS